MGRFRAHGALQGCCGLGGAVRRGLCVQRCRAVQAGTGGMNGTKGAPGSRHAPVRPRRIEARRDPDLPRNAAD
ncbi:hypothetical protein SL003B_2895 [Polymorphum gilvum SL003B-26A1]|uniref:Uncharacterized protein n=1 Tax=Polymorphum gilvum (strain LMG 25793 / CGMCC 1.9160 / SL003B-26A1) TaxID=991905 RepID=F2J6E3_POLGS|nr:hypothetical protein SL003B_2895 [Polymorphum gilvum SL003B-26A1]